ncbi:MAG: hypothetical protein EBQ75_07715 [Actinobacteria bacterium]|nr:hypothetical protein [Actinomycetota bacterium]
MTRVDATIQARTGSSRLPGKVLRDLDGKPLLQYQIERIQQSQGIERVILATTDRPQDDALAHLAESMGSTASGVRRTTSSRVSVVRFERSTLRRMPNSWVTTRFPTRR